MALLALVPLGFVATYAVLVGPTEAWELVVRPRVGMLLWNTVRLAVGCMLLSSVLGVGLAWLVERTDVPAKGLWHGLLVAPLAVPAFVNSYAWVSLDRSIVGFGGALLVITLSYYPLVYLPVVAGLRGLDPALEESAWSLGHSRWRSFWSVVLPQLRPALLGGMLLVGLHLLAEFGALQLLRFPTFTTAIYDLYGSTFNGAAATMIAGVLVLLCLLLLLGELRLRGQRRFARVGQGAARSAVPVRLGAGRVPATAGLVALVALTLGVPTYALLHWLRVGASTEFPLAELATAAASTVALAASRRPGHHRARTAGRVARRAPPGHRSRPPSSAARTSPTRCRASWSPWPSSPSSLQLVPVALPDRAAARARLRRPVPAARRGVGPRRARAGAGAARRRRAQPRLQPADDRPPGHAAGDRRPASGPARRWSSSRSPPSSPRR